MSIQQTIAATDHLSRFLNDSEQNPEVTDAVAYVGSGGPRFFLALSPNDPQPNKAFMVVNTEKAEQINTVMKRVDRFIVEQMPEASGRTDILFLGPAALGTVELRQARLRRCAGKYTPRSARSDRLARHRKYRS